MLFLNLLQAAEMKSIQQLKTSNAELSSKKVRVYHFLYLEHYLF